MYETKPELYIDLTLVAILYAFIYLDIQFQAGFSSLSTDLAVRVSRMSLPEKRVE